MAERNHSAVLSNDIACMIFCISSASCTPCLIRSDAPSTVSLSSSSSSKLSCNITSSLISSDPPLFLFFGRPADDRRRADDFCADASATSVRLATTTNLCRREKVERKQRVLNWLCLLALRWENFKKMWPASKLRWRRDRSALARMSTCMKPLNAPGVMPFCCKTFQPSATTLPSLLLDSCEREEVTLPSISFRLPRSSISSKIVSSSSSVTRSSWPMPGRCLTTTSTPHCSSADARLVSGPSITAQPSQA
mmetsp:Transcript_25687/g.64636  ORF Transcript_25687/g.64636 Transcript_25687/m.64636 type:complete len:251 (+) Transcript_25687:5298-6050(+)